MFKTNMKNRVVARDLALVLAAVALIAVGLSSTKAASDKYKFTIRGDVTKVDRTNNTVTIYTRFSSADAKDDLAGNTIEFNVSGAKFYKYKDGTKVRTTLGNVPVQLEVVAKGAKRGTDRYNISELTVNPNDFSLVGTVQGHNKGDKILTVQVTSSTYKESAIKGNDIKLYYGSNTKFRNQALIEINSDEIANNKEKIKVTGVVVSGWKYEARDVIDGYDKAK